MVISKYVFNTLLKFFLTLFFVVSCFLFFIFKLYLMNNNIFQLACSQMKKDTKHALNPINLSFLTDNEHEVITITETYDSLFNIIFSTDFISHFTPLSDSSDYLRELPGFFSVRNGGTNSDIVFRGMFGSRLHILDGSGEIFGACSSRMDSSSAYIFPENFDIITLIKGPQTVLWGPVASGGIVHFERYTPYFYQPGIKIRSSTMMGSYNRLDKNIDTVFGNSFGYFRLMGVISQASDYLDARKRVIPSSWNKWNTNMTFGFTPVSDLLFELNLSQSNGNAKYAGRGFDAMCFSRESFELRFKKKDTVQKSLYSVDLAAWYYYVNHVMGTFVDNLNGSNISSIKKNKFFSTSYKEKNYVDRLISGVRGIFSYQWEDIQMHCGADMQINQHRRKVINNDWYKDSCFQDTGLFIELDWKLALFSKLVSGIRLEHTLVKDYVLKEEMKQRSVIYPAGFMRYEHIFFFPDVLNTYIGVGANSRFPDYWELIILKSGKKMGRDAFYRVKEEKNIQLDFGTHFKSEKNDFWISTYSGYIKDFILYRYYDNYGLKNSDVYRNRSSVENIDAIMRGSEIGWCYRLNDNLSLENNISYVFGKNITNATPLPQIPPLDAKMTLTWEYGLWTSKCIWRLVAPQFRIAINDGNVIARDMTTSKGFSILSVNLLRQMSREIKLGCGVNNLLNKNYSEHLSMNGNKRFENFGGLPLTEPGRTWWMRIGVIF